MYKSIILITIMLATIGCNQDPKLEKSQPDQSYHLITVGETKEMLTDSLANIIIMDVRTPKETAEGMIGDAITVDVKSKDFTDKVSEMDKEKTYLVYCRTGIRSRRATTIMRNLGFKEIYEVNGGYKQWTAENEN